MRGPRWYKPESIAARPKIDNHFGNFTHLTMRLFSNLYFKHVDVDVDTLRTGRTNADFQCPR